MPKGGFNFRIKPLPQNRSIKHLMEELPKRVQVVRRMLVREAAVQLIALIKEKIPNGHEYAWLKRLLVVRDISGLNAQTEAGSVVLVDSTKKVEKEQKELIKKRMLIWVLDKKKREEIFEEEIEEESDNEEGEEVKKEKKKKGVNILKEHNPWTFDTLPYVPTKKEALVTFKMESLKKVAEVRKDRKAILGEVNRELEKIDVKLLDILAGKKEFNQKLRELLEAVDLAAIVLALEFGLRGEKMLPHWRPSISYIRNQFPIEFFSDDLVHQVLGDPDFLQWKNLPKQISMVTVKRVQELKQFQDKVRVR